MGVNGGPNNIEDGLTFVVDFKNPKSFVLRPFIITVDTTLTGGTGSASDTFILPTRSGYNYNCDIDWGDGTSDSITTWNDSALTHTYPTGSTYTIKIDRIFDTIYFNSGGDRLKLMSIEQWGDSLWKELHSAFQGCQNMVGNFTDTPVLSVGTSMAEMFANTDSFNSDIGGWDVSNVTSMSSMFSGCAIFNNGGSGSINNWNTSGILSMSNMFATAHSFNQNIGGWDVSNVTNMSYMFSYANAFNQDIGAWNVSSVTTMFGMFYGSIFNNGGSASINNWVTTSLLSARRLFSISSFNQPIGSWNMSSVTTLEEMFESNSVFNQDIGAWNVSNVTNVSQLFNLATSFNNGGSATINNWVFSISLTSMASMFTSSAFNQNISGWDVSNVTNMSLMFSTTTAFNQPIGTWNVSSLTNMSSMFASSQFNQDIGAWNVSSVTSMATTFNASQFNNGGSATINNWVTTSLISAVNTFRSCLFNQPIGNWDMSSVTSVKQMFEFNYGFNQDIGAWDVGNVIDFTEFMNGKSPANYSASNLDSIYNQWSLLTVQSGLTVDFGTIDYTSGGTAGKTILEGAPNNWSIVDGVEV